MENLKRASNVETSIECHRNPMRPPHQSFVAHQSVAVLRLRSLPFQAVGVSIHLGLCQKPLLRSGFLPLSSMSIFLKMNVVQSAISLTGMLAVASWNQAAAPPWVKDNEIVCSKQTHVAMFAITTSVYADVGTPLDTALPLVYLVVVHPNNEQPTLLCRRVQEFRHVRELWAESSP